MFSGHAPIVFEEKISATGSLTLKIVIHNGRMSLSRKSHQKWRDTALMQSQASNPPPRKGIVDQ